MRIGQRLAAAQASATVRLAEQARSLAAEGREVIDLAEGEPDFDTPAHVIEAAHEAALRGETRYTDVAGTPALRAAVAESFRTAGVDVPPGQVIVGTGAKQLVFNALMATLEPGDEAIVPTPAWVSYPDMVRLCGGVPVLLPSRAGEGWRLQAEALRAAITPRTRWLLLNSPNNPTGAVLSAADLAALAEVLREHPHVAVLCDDIYAEILHDRAVFFTMAAVAPDLADRVLTVNGVSKSWAMTGWRIGYAAGPTDLISAMVKLQGQQTTNASSVSQAAALAALTGPQVGLAERRAIYTRRRDLVADALAAVPGFRLGRPAGAFYHFVDCAGVLGRRTPEGGTLADDAALAAYLLGTAGVASVPGTAFGAPGHLRLCYAKSEADLSRACDRIVQAVVALV